MSSPVFQWPVLDRPRIALAIGQRRAPKHGYAAIVETRGDQIAHLEQLGTRGRGT
jgi:hypothetical protein